MAKRTTRPVQPSAPAEAAPAEAAPARPEPAPGSVLTEPMPASVAPAASAAGDPTKAVAADAGVPAATAGSWPEGSIAPAGPHCPWCSAPLASTDLTTCPSCGAQINAPADAEVPGVTTIDVAALAWKAGAPPRRNRLLTWIAGDDAMPPDSSGAARTAVEPPSPAVRREMLRLELEAEGISLPHDAEPAGADEAAAVAEAGQPDPAQTSPSSSDPAAGATGA